MDNKEYIFFDLDGTLTEPAEGITNSVAYALEKFGIVVKDKTTLQKFIGPPLIDSFMEFYGFSRENAEKAVAFYREYYLRLRPQYHLRLSRDSGICKGYGEDGRQHHQYFLDERIHSPHQDTRIFGSEGGYIQLYAVACGAFLERGHPR